MKRAFPAERVEPLAEAPRNLADDRPKRRYDAQSAQMCHGKQPRSVAQNDRAHIMLLEVAEFIKGLLELRIRRRHGIRIRQSEGCLAESSYAVSHGHFAREGLEGAQALIGVLDLRLKLDVLLFEVFLIAAQ